MSSRIRGEWCGVGRDGTVCTDQVSCFCCIQAGVYHLYSTFQLSLFVLVNIPKSWKILYLFHK